MTRGQGLSPEKHGAIIKKGAAVEIARIKAQLEEWIAENTPLPRGRR